jgi:hypothetical protein
MRDIIADLWRSICCKKADVTPTQDVPSKDEPSGWKHARTMHHEKLVEEHLRIKAYLIAEKDGFRKNPIEYWEEARRGENP